MPDQLSASAAARHARQPPPRNSGTTADGPLLTTSASDAASASATADSNCAAAEPTLHDFLFRDGLHRFGIQPDGRGGAHFREWAPAALGVALVGDFNGWDASAHVCAPGPDGVWTAHLAAFPPPRSRYKIQITVRTARGPLTTLRVPAWAKSIARDDAGDACAVVDDPMLYDWRHPRPSPAPLRSALRVYEAHVGIASAEPVVASYAHFRTAVLPRIASLGYNCLLLIGVLEHGYYASFGYQVTSYFAPAARFGSPSELQALIDAAHALGLGVLLELVHSHASSNTREGLSGLDGNDDGGYFVAGRHKEWGSRLFDFAKVEVRRFLLANLAWWATAYRVDGFRFDAVSTALYRGRLDGCDGVEPDPAACGYFALANRLAHELATPPLITIAEEHTSLPGLCAPASAGGLGFDFRQALGLPPLWARVLAPALGDGGPRRRPVPLRLGELVRGLCARRRDERRLAYCECHDQSLVGDATLAHRLLGPAIYGDGMRIDVEDASVARGVALHKLARLLTSALGGEAYLNFIGNEFGHPEWLDFPREGNRHSLLHARRRWDLADDPKLRYGMLRAFDAAVQPLAARWLGAPAPRVDGDGDGDEPPCRYCERRQLVWFVRGGLLFVFGFGDGGVHDLDVADAARPCADRTNRGRAGGRLRRRLDSGDVAFGGRGGGGTATVVEEAGAKPRLVRVAMEAQSACVFEWLGST